MLRAHQVFIFLAGDGSVGLVPWATALQVAVLASTRHYAPPSPKDILDKFRRFVLYFTTQTRMLINKTRSPVAAKSKKSDEATTIRLIPETVKFQNQ
jgi:hypothetical protein